MLGRKEKAAQIKQTIQLEEINQKILAKERRLKIYLDRIKQFRQNRIYQDKEKNSTNKSVENTWRHTSNRVTKKYNNFGEKYGKKEDIKEKPHWISTLEKS